MSFQLTRPQAEEAFRRWTREYDVWAPMVFEGEGCFSDTDIIRYGKPERLEDIAWEKKSDYSFKEVLLAINETLFYFTEDQTTVPKGPQKDILVFLRACDFHAVRRLDQIYLKNGSPDFYYARVRERVKFVLMGCRETCASGFCVSMGTNVCTDYDAALRVEEDRVLADLRDEALRTFAEGGTETEFVPDHVTENREKVTLPRHLSLDSFRRDLWKEYGERCIGCGRCNFACPTCTCFTMQDIFYKDNPRAGERRRVWASCQVGGFDEIAGGIRFRRTQGEQMRYKVMHKIWDFGQRFGYPMCVGCGRCDDICPEYISYSTLISRLAKEEDAT